MKDRNLLSIKKFSELTGIKESKLRHYDEVKLFQPVMRGKNGYRYYSVEQTITISFITVLNAVNIPIKKIKEIKNDRSPGSVLALLQSQVLELNKELLNLQQAYMVINLYCSLIQEGMFADENTIEILQMTVMPIELGAVNDFADGNIYDSFFKFLRQRATRKISSAYPIGRFYEDMDAFIKAPGWPTRFFSIVPSGQDTKKAGKHLVGYTKGNYGNLGDLPQRMRAYADEHGLVFDGPVYELYLHNEVAVERADNYLIQVSVPIKERKS